MNELTKLPNELPVAPVATQPTVAEILKAVVDKGVSGENVNALKEIVSLYERMEDRNAAKEFNRAFSQLQAELPVIVAKTEIPKRGKYERFEDVMHVVGPILHKHGFSVSFSQTPNDKRIGVTCHLRHISGHSEENSFTVRVGPADSETQSDAKASTTAKRNALLQALNIVIRQDCMQSEDDDARLGGDPDDKITPAQAAELERRAREINARIPDFLKYAGATSFADIQASKYAELDKSLQIKEGKGK